MTVNEVLPVVLYILGAILLTALIVLTIKLIIVTNKMEKVVDNITDKVRTLDGLFAVIGNISNKVTMLTDKFVDNVALIVDKLFKRKDNRNE